MYLPDVPRQAYQDLLASLAQEFTYTFGGCTVVRNLEGHYLARRGETIRDRINLIYTDAPFGFDENLTHLSRYADQLRDVSFRALDEETVLVAVTKVWHSAE